jgi:hypothetical protein
MSFRIQESAHFLRTARDRANVTLRDTWMAARSRFAAYASAPGGDDNLDGAERPTRFARRQHSAGRPHHVTGRLSRVQKAGALIPMGILVSGWAVAVGNTGLANATADGENAIPEVPATALDQPAVARSTAGGLDPQAGLSGAMATLSTNGIPSAALYAYKHAETVLADADPACHLPWNLVAAIGRVESNHGRIQGNALSADGVAQPGISKPALGPMQLTQGTFDTVSIDSDGDGAKNPQDIDDAATAAGIFLCSGEGDLSSDADARAAVARYGDGKKYVNSVMKISASYANGQFSQTPDGFSTSTILTSMAYDRTLTAEERESAKRSEDEKEESRQRDERNRRNRATNRGTNQTTSGGESSNDGGSDDGGDGGGNDGGGDGGGSGGDPVQETVKNLQETVKDTTDSVNETVKKTTDSVNETVKKLTGR